MKKYLCVLALLSLAALGSDTTRIQADPCGMIPPIYTGDTAPISRKGQQTTYAYFKDGVETFVIRPGFTGNVDNFGMLIPFPSPPAIRKVPDNIFSQIRNAIDPPEVVYNMMPHRRALAVNAMPRDAAGLKFDRKKREVQVLKKEAVGMYEVAVLQAGSAESLKKWLSENGYQYPTGMEKVTNEYVEENWCFVAVKTRLGSSEKTQPRPGQRDIQSKLPAESEFDGFVQGMGFRFKTDKLIVPMRLSAFNGGNLNNVVYLLTDGPKRIRSIPEEFVVRQLDGQELVDNLTKPLPLRIVGGDITNIPQSVRDNLAQRRNPEPKNGLARELFASDMLAVANGTLSLPHEEKEKHLLNVAEYFQLRGKEIDSENALALKAERSRTLANATSKLKDMTLTVVHGDFPREVLANENLTFAEFEMPRNRNNRDSYEANQYGPAPKQRGNRIIGAIDWKQIDRALAAGEPSLQPNIRNASMHPLTTFWSSVQALSLTGLLLGTLFFFGFRRKLGMLVLALAVGLGGMVAGVVAAEAPSSPTPLEISNEVLDKFCTPDAAANGFQEIVQMAKQGNEKRQEIIDALLKRAKENKDLPKRGWAIAALAEIGGQDVDEHLLGIHANTQHEKVVRTWAAAARVKNTMTLNGLIEKANLIREFPALGRPIGMRIVEQLKVEKSASAEQIITIVMKLPQLQRSLTPTILGLGEKELLTTMFQGADNNVRRTAAGYVGTLANQSPEQNVTGTIVEKLKFDPERKDLPWGDKALFLPGVKWDQKEAKGLVGNLIRWMVWCDKNGNNAGRQQIHNNIRSLSLARAAGYRSPGWRESDVASWLNVWQQVVGREGIEEILKEVGVEQNPKYTNLFN